jgi:hypothetical protein
VTIDIPEEAVRFFEERILAAHDANAWIAYHQNELRRRYARLLAQGLRRGAPLDERSQRHLAALSEDYHGALGLAEGLMANPEGYAPGWFPWSGPALDASTRSSRNRRFNQAALRHDTGHARRARGSAPRRRALAASRQPGGGAARGFG